LLLEGEVVDTCRCGECCRRLIIEVELEDAEREPRIKEVGSPIHTPAELTGTGRRELEGYLLNGKDDLACVFMDKESNLCTIHATRPLACRLFDRDGEGREQLIRLGIIDRATHPSRESPPGGHAPG
jgi:Fe-S-cluster containining protein